MKLLSLLGPSAGGNTAIAHLVLFVSLLLAAQAFNFNPIPDPNLELSQLGRIGLAGDFAGVSLYKYEGQGQGGGSNGNQSVLGRYPDGGFGSLADSDGVIHALCPFVMDGELAGVIVAGNFTSLGGLESQGVALFNPNDSSVTPLPGISGLVSTLYCDDASNTVYVGGSFRGANSTNGIAWVGTAGWTNLPFLGFNGPVSSIVKATNGKMVFGGSFTGLGNATVLEEEHQQIINLSSAELSSEGATTTTVFNDPSNIVCKTNGTDGPDNTWLLRDGQPGAWKAEFGYGFQPSKLTLWNTHQDGRGTKTWRFTAYGGIMNFTYVDPIDGAEKSCSSECPLSNDPAIESQDFFFVNTVGMAAFRIDISEWYGKGGGLAGIQLSQNDIYSYAIDDFNEPECSVPSASAISKSTTTGPWKETESFDTNSRYLTAKLESASVDAEVVFFPHIRQSGNYSVNIYTPGCRADDTCETRGLVNVTGSVGNGETFQTEIYQTNYYEKYDHIYFGYIEAGSENFRPSVTVAPSSGQSGPITVVAQRIGFTLIDSTGGLNSLYEYDPEAASSDEVELGKTIVEKAGKALESGAEINAIVPSGDITFVGGNYSSDEYDNIFAINETGWTSLPQGGLNGAVLAMYLNGSSLYVGGEFTSNGRDASRQLSNICVYDVSTEEWGTIGGGVNGRVTNIVPVTFNITADAPEVVLSVSGAFKETNAWGDNQAAAVSGFAVWVPSRANWLHNLALTEMSFEGSLAAAVDLPDNIGTLYAGSLSSFDVGANGAAMFVSDKLAKFPVQIERSPVTQGPITKRATAQDVSISGVATGKFFEKDGLNITVLGGHFIATGSDGSPINNLVMVNSSEGESVQGIADLSSESTVLSMDISDNTLFAGGVITGTANGAELNGLVIYDLKAASLPTQPPALDGDSVVVYDISVKEDGDVYVAGSFESAGSLPCPGVCVFTKSSSQWNRPGMGFAGVVQALEWKDKNSVIAAGELEVNGNATTIATYNAVDQKWTEFPGANGIPGPVVAMTPANRDISELWVAGVASNGSTFLMKYKDKKWESVQDLGEETTIRGLKILTVSKDHESSGLMSRNQVLILTGSIAIAGFGTAAAAIYDGRTFQPYILTSATDDGSGYLAQFFSQRRNSFSDADKPMALGFVVLIALAIALGLTFLLFLIGVLLDRWHKKREGYMPAPTSTFDKNAQMSRLPPEEIFGTINKGNRAPVI